MLKIIVFNQKKSLSDSGFSLIEVLVAALITFFFVIGSMQALVLATALRIKAQEKQRATQIIQEDIEQVQNRARVLAANHIRCSATTYDDGYAKALWDDLGSNVLLPGNKNLLDNVSTSKQYGLRRIHIPNSPAPHKILRIRYEVREWDTSASPPKFVGDLNDPDAPEIIAKDYIEVIPNAAFECP